MRFFRKLVVAAFCFHFCSLACFAQDKPASTEGRPETPAAEENESKQESKKPVRLKVGDAAPLFAGKDDKGEKWDAVALKGKKILVVYFYPADMTPGCTKQACAYRDAMTKLKRKDVAVIGVSGDSVKNHQHFRDKHQLNFPLLADPQGEIAKAFGVKTFKGGKFSMDIEGEPIAFERTLTAQRWTFVIDKQWKIAHVDRKVNAAKDSEKVFKVIEKQP